MSGGEIAGSGSPARPVEPRTKVLVVDDDPDVVLAIRLLFEGQGYEVASALTAQDGKRLVESERPDLILLDVMLPGGTEGFQLVWGLRNHPDATLRDTPVVILSALHRTTDLRLYPEQADSEYAPGEFLPVQAFLDKPVMPDELTEALESVLAERR